MTQLSSEKPELFKGRHFNHLPIIQAPRWYVTYKLSYRDVCDLMAERGVTVVHTTVLRWVQCFVPCGSPKVRLPCIFKAGSSCCVAITGRETSES
jgi:hypothetical protein